MLTQIQQDILFGTLLGDGNLQTETKGKTWRYRAIHKSEHKDYLLHKYENLKSLCKSEPIYETIYDSRTCKEYQRVYFNTVINSSLSLYADMFYTFDKTNQTWVKDVPINLETSLTARALAYFYMDDGSLKWEGHSNAMRISTESFSEEGVNRIKSAIENLYNVKITLLSKSLKAGKIGYITVIPEKSSSAFREIIKPYLVDCMKYKVSDGQRGHL